MRKTCLLITFFFLSMLARAQDTMISMDGAIEVVPDFLAELKKGVTDKIKQLDFITFDGTLVHLDSTYARPYVINVWATWCGPCLEEIPMLNKIKNACNECDVDFFALSHTEEANSTESFLVSNPFHFRQVTASFDYIINNRLRNGFPTTIFVDQKGNVLYKIMGGNTEPDEFRIGLEKIGCLMGE